MLRYLLLVFLTLIFTPKFALAEASMDLVCDKLFEEGPSYSFTAQDIKMNSDQAYDPEQVRNVDLRGSHIDFYSEHISNILKNALEHLRSDGLKRNFLQYFKPSPYYFAMAGKYGREIEKLKQSKIHLFNKLTEEHNKRVKDQRVHYYWVLKISRAIAEGIDFMGIVPLPSNSIRNYPHSCEEIPAKLRATYAAHDAILSDLTEEGIELSEQKELVYHPYHGEIDEGDIVSATLNGIRYLNINFNTGYTNGIKLSPEVIFKNDIESEATYQHDIVELQNLAKKLAKNFAQFEREVAPMVPWVFDFMFWMFYEEPEVYTQYKASLGEGEIDPKLTEAFRKYIEDTYAEGSRITIEESSWIIGYYLKLTESRST